MRSIRRFGATVRQLGSCFTMHAAPQKVKNVRNSNTVQLKRILDEAVPWTHRENHPPGPLGEFSPEEFALH